MKDTDLTCVGPIRTPGLLDKAVAVLRVAVAAPGWRTTNAVAEAATARPAQRRRTVVPRHHGPDLGRSDPSLRTVEASGPALIVDAEPLRHDRQFCTVFDCAS